MKFIRNSLILAAGLAFFSTNAFAQAPAATAASAAPTQSELMFLLQSEIRAKKTFSSEEQFEEYFSEYMKSRLTLLRSPLFTAKISAALISAELSDAGVALTNAQTKRLQGFILRMAKDEINPSEAKAFHRILLKAPNGKHANEIRTLLEQNYLPAATKA